MLLLSYFICCTDDPLEPNRHCIKAKTAILKDPVKIDAQKAAAEGAMLVDDDDHDDNNNSMNNRHSSTNRRNSKPKLCKETLNVELWASGKIEATPHGTFSKMMNKNKGGNGNNQASAANPTQKSHVVFDHFNYPQRDKAATDKEMPRGKRIHPITIYANPSKVFHDQVPDSFKEELVAMKPPVGHTYMS